ncbi:AAA-ATPase At2g46620-like [Nicotiana tabacum]|uniref:AAA-ATPase At2g46620-like n=2 Tax=Nicotiana TaxID=4085 RepID=A0A1S3ZP87_TOBAC|nr:PREDICTED: mitochondrial chaperone BCS1-like [Nicotiana sylvestris]XP_016466073.1 PREDICTED: AAA-ATPase At2g46620-like [Nicotiana tabacum]
MWVVNILFLLVLVPCFLFLARFILYRTALIFVLRKWANWVDDRIHVHQYLKVAELNENGQDNQFYRRVSLYVNSLPSVEDSNFTNLFSGKKSTDIILSLDDNQVIEDEFLGARISWVNKVERFNNGVCNRSFLLRIKKKDKRRILPPYFQHIHTVSDDIEQRRRELKLFLNNGPSENPIKGRWRSVPFTHPATLDTIAMDTDLKNKVKSDLDTFTKSQNYYHKMGRAWKRNYLLYGPSGTGKSSFIGAMANFLNYDVYDVDLSRVSDDSDLKLLLLQTTNRSLIVIEDLDRLINEKLITTSFSGLLNFMDGIVNSCCGDEKIMVFTMNSKEHIDPAMLRPGRIDVHIHFPLCDFNSFRSLANNYLGVKEHKLFPQVEEIFQSGATMSPAAIGELMMVNRSSPSRALKSVITALQSNGTEGKIAGRGKRLSDSASSPALPFPSPSPQAEETGGVNWKDSVPVAKEFRKLYGLLRMKSCKKPDSFDQDSEMIER